MTGTGKKDPEGAKDILTRCSEFTAYTSIPSNSPLPLCQISICIISQVNTDYCPQ